MTIEQLSKACANVGAGYTVVVCSHSSKKEEAMKVTAKKPCVSGVYEVVDEGSRYYISKDACGFLIALDKADYEPVQEWDDVTGAHNGTDATIALMSSHFKLTRHEVSTLSSKMKFYAYLLERKRA